MAGQTVTLKTNIPHTMTLQYCNYAKSKTEGWADRLQLKATDGSAVYVPLACGGDLVNIQAIRKTGEKDRYGHPAFEVLGRPTIVVTKMEEGTKKFTTIHLAGDAAENTPPAPEKNRQAKAKAAPVADRSLDRLEGIMTWALAAADRIWNGDAPPETLHATAACLFIEANRQGLGPPADVVPAPEAE